VTTPRAAAIYARISSDVEGLGAGVGRQVEDCRKLATSLGWTVSGEYVDNDVSAYSGKRRPDYERMLADLADGTVDAVLVYHIDRLTRRPIELEDFLSAVDRAKVRHVKFVTGDTDVHTGDGLLMARIMGAVAANESASKSRRVRRKMEQVAAEGRPHGGSQRPYGYAADKITVVAEEAAIIRTLVARFLAGESSRSLASWLEAQELSTVSGKPWRTGTLKAILISARIAGLRTHRGQVVGPAVWDAIITEDEHRRVLATYAQKKVSVGDAALRQVRQHPVQQRTRTHPALRVYLRPRP
jgi:DNA invertase Pin-like site-specific DNA recombinase